MQCVLDNILQGQSWDHIETVLVFTKILTVLQRRGRKGKKTFSSLRRGKEVLISHWFIFLRLLILTEL